MARTKQTARKSSGGKAPRQMLSCKSATQFRAYMTSQQSSTYSTSDTKQQSKTSYLNYENIFYSYFFNTGPPGTTKRFETRFSSGGGKNSVTGQVEKWLGMSFNSKFDGAGMKKHGRPQLNLVIVLDISGSMGMGFGNEGGVYQTKLSVAKECLQTLVDQLQPNDSFGLVRFNHDATVHHKLTKWKNVKKPSLKSGISSLAASGSTCLSAAIETATDMFASVVEEKDSTNRIIFLTDLCSTVDSVNDEKKLLSAIKTNAGRGIFTSVVGIGMDLNVKLVEDISKTRGAKYLSVDNSSEFKRIMNQEFDYDVTVLAFNIRISLLTKEYSIVKGYGSPEVNNLKPGKPVIISSEFPSWQNDKGESKGGMLLFKFEKKKGAKSAPNMLKMEVRFENLEGVEHCEVIDVQVNTAFQDTGVRKAALLVQYVDLHNDYVLDARKSKTKFLELFQSFRVHFTSELEAMKDKSLATFNKGDLELIDKIIDLEFNPTATDTPTASTSNQYSTSFTAAAFPCAPAKRIAGTRRATTQRGSPAKKKPTLKKKVQWQTTAVTSPNKAPSTSRPSSVQAVTQTRSTRKRSSPSDAPAPAAKKSKGTTTRASTRGKATVKTEPMAVKREKPVAASTRSRRGNSKKGKESRATIVKPMATRSSRRTKQRT